MTWFPSGWKPELKLHAVNIFFNAPTFDHIKKDAKTNTMMQISVIGGTLGLFTCFSIMSGIEVLYYLIKDKRENKGFGERGEASNCGPQEAH